MSLDSILLGGGSSRPQSRRQPGKGLAGHRGVLARQWGRLDLGLFRHEALPLLELRGDAAILVRFDGLYAKLQRRLG